MNVAGLILAAGESRRMGFPKALLSYRGETFLDRLIGLFQPRCSWVIVVLGAEAERIRAEARRTATYVINPDYRRGMLSSLQCGLRAVPAEAEGVLFTLVDHPAVTESTLDALLAEPLPETAPLLRVPRYGDQRGHPIWFSRGLIQQFLSIPEGSAARELVRRYETRTEFLDVDDPGIVSDIDDAEAYRRLAGVRQ